MDKDEWLGITETVVANYDELRRTAPLRSDDADQRKALELVSWDIGAFLRAQLVLARGAHWSPAYSLGRLITERGEHLIALHHEPGFARRFMNATRALTDEGAKGASRRVTDARSGVRRFIRDVVADDAVSREYLEAMIQMASVGSLAVHPSAFVPTLAALNDPDDPDFLAYEVASISTMALFSLATVAERRVPGASDYGYLRELIRAVGEQIISESQRWDEQQPS